VLAKLLCAVPLSQNVLDSGAGRKEGFHTWHNRLLWATAQLVGKAVRVQTVDGCWLRGRLLTISTSTWQHGGLGVALGGAVEEQRPGARRWRRLLIPADQFGQLLTATVRRSGRGARRHNASCCSYGRLWLSLVDPGMHRPGQGQPLAQPPRRPPDSAARPAAAGGRSPRTPWIDWDSWETASTNSEAAPEHPPAEQRALWSVRPPTQARRPGGQLLQPWAAGKVKFTGLTQNLQVDPAV
jgi:hypothetical protein